MPIKVGELYSELILDPAKFNTGLHETEAKAKGWGASLGSIFSHTGAIMALGLAGAGVAALDFLKDSVEAAKANEVAYGRLTASLKANVAGWDGNIEAIKKANEAGANLGFTDNEMADSMSRLVAATHSVAEAEKVRAVAMDLARFKGISLMDASEALVKVEAGSYRVLKSLGIQLKTGATQMEALAAVEKVAGGQALEFANNTTAGAEAIAGAKWEQAQEKLGAKLLPLLVKLANFTADVLVPALELVADNVDKLVPVIETLATILGVRLVMSLAGTVAGFISGTVNAVIFGNALTGLTVDAGAASTAVTGVGLASKISLGIAVASILAVWATYNDVKGKIDAQTQALTQQTTKFASTASLADLEKARAGVKGVLDETKQGFHPIEDWLGMSGTSQVQQQLDVLDAQIASLKAQQEAAARAAIEAAVAARKGWADYADAPVSAMDHAAKEQRAVIEKEGKSLAAATRRSALLAANSYGDGWRDGVPGARKAFDAIRQAIANQQAKFAMDARIAGLRADAEYGKGIKDGRDRVKQDWQALLDDLKNPLKKHAEAMHLLGMLASKQLRKGLRSEDPAAVSDAENLTADILQQLRDLKIKPGQLGREGMRRLRAAMRSSNPLIRKAARDLFNEITHPASTLPSKMYRYGVHAAQNYIAGVSSMYNEVANAGQMLAKLMGAAVKASIPAADSPLHDVTLWGVHLVQEYAKSVIRGFPVAKAAGKGLAATVRDAVGTPSFPTMEVPRLSLAAVPRMAGPQLAMAGAGALGQAGSSPLLGALHVHLHDVGSDVSRQAASRFGQHVADSTAQALREQSARLGRRS